MIPPIERHYALGMRCRGNLVHPGLRYFLSPQLAAKACVDSINRLCEHAGWTPDPTMEASILSKIQTGPDGYHVQRHIFCVHWTWEIAVL